jgi:hypothetical protein
MKNQDENRTPEAQNNIFLSKTNTLQNIMHISFILLLLSQAAGILADPQRPTPSFPIHNVVAIIRPTVNESTWSA